MSIYSISPVFPFSLQPTRACFLSRVSTETALSRSPMSSMSLKPMIHSQTSCYLTYHLTQLITQSLIHSLHLVFRTPYCPPTSFVCSFSNSSAGSSFFPKVINVGASQDSTLGLLFINLNNLIQSHGF